MKWNQMMVSAAIVIWLVGPVFGDASPMVERHIFMPEEQAEAAAEAMKEKSPEVERLERELVFTGVIIGPDGKRAMIQEKGHTKNKGAEKASLLREGDEIRGMSIKEIGRNYLVLSGQGGDVRLNLFQEGKDRPAPPPEPKIAETQVVPTPPAPVAQQEEGSDKPPVQGAQPGRPGQPQVPPRPPTPQTVQPAQAMTPGQESQPPSSSGDAAAQSNPFADALKRAQQQNVREGRRNLVNPFLNAIRQSQGNTTQE